MAGSRHRYGTPLLLGVALLLTIGLLFVLEERRLERSSYATRASQLAQVASGVSDSIYGIVVGSRTRALPDVEQREKPLDNEELRAEIRRLEEGEAEQRLELRSQSATLPSAPADEEGDAEDDIDDGRGAAASEDAEVEPTDGAEEEDGEGEPTDGAEEEDGSELEALREKVKHLELKLSSVRDAEEDRDAEALSRGGGAADEAARSEGGETGGLHECTPLGTQVDAARAETAGERRGLSPELLAEVAVSNRVIVTWANLHYLDFVLNWYYHLTSTCATNVLVGAMDDELYDELAARGITAFSMQSGLTTEDFGWGSSNFHKMGREKINLVGAVTSMGFDLLLTDVDTVFLRDPNAFVDRYPDADVLTSSDHLKPTAVDGGLEHYTGCCGDSELGYARSPANIGIMYFSSKAKEFGVEWGRRLDENAKLWDQNVFNDMMRTGLPESGWLNGGKKDNEREDRLFTSFDDTLTFGILPVTLFCSGHGYFVQDLPLRVMDQPPYVVHATFQYGGTEGKRNRFRERLLWNDPPEYFRPQEGSAGFLALNINVPQELLTGPDADTRLGHFRLVNHQLRHVRAALALAKLLRRVVVLPELWVMYDRFFYPVDDGRNGGAWGPPRGAFVAPADHVLAVEKLQKEFPYREYSFLRNPRYPHESTTTVRVVASGGGAGAGAGGGAGREEVVALEPMATASAVVAALEEHEGAELLVFDEVAELVDPTVQEFWDVDFELHAGVVRPLDPSSSEPSELAFETFKEALRQVGGQWCCERGHRPGHIFYDLLFDVIPHRDRTRRLWETPNIGDVFN